MLIKIVNFIKNLFSSGDITININSMNNKRKLKQGKNINNGPQFNNSNQINNYYYRTSPITIEEKPNDLAMEMLENAINDENATIIKIEGIDGLTLQCGSKLYSNLTPREEANIDNAFDWLLNNNYIKPVGFKNEIFNVTKKGFDYFDSKHEGSIDDLKYEVIDEWED